MERVEFIIPGRPVPWKRQRTNGKRRFPAKGQSEAKAAVQSAWLQARRVGLFAGEDVAVAMRVHAVFKLPDRLKKGDPRRMGSPHTFRPDGDNIGKLIKDALNGFAYKDDCQVATLTVHKQWSDHDRTIVTLEFYPVDRMGRAA